jgi:parallel beta-helix repeat protein
MIMQDSPALDNRLSALFARESPTRVGFLWASDALSARDRMRTGDAGVASSLPAPPGSGTPHDPIVIMQNSDFAAQGWPGSGTPSDPYGIEGLNINRTSPAGYCIEIRETTAYFIIRRCWLEGSSYTCIFLGNVTNGRILDNHVLHGSYGIRLASSNSTIIANNTITSSYSAGVLLDRTEADTVVNNTVSGIAYGFSIVVEASTGCSVLRNHVTGVYNWDGYGLYFGGLTASTIANNTCSTYEWGMDFWASPNNTIANNSLTGCGFYFGQPLSGYRQTEVKGNTVNGKPLVFWYNQVGGVVPSGAGQVILANCSHVTVQYQTIRNATIGILLLQSHDNTIHHNTCNDSMRNGIWLYCSSANVIDQNTCAGNGYYGILLETGSNNSLTENVCVRDDRYGIGLYDAHNNTLASNTCCDGWEGIFLDTDSYSNLVRDSNCSRNDWGLDLSGSDNNTLSDNFCSQNEEGILLIDARSNSITGNALFKNDYGLCLFGSGNNSIKGNSFSNCGMYVSPSQSNVPFWTLRQREVTGNTVNGKPLVYLQDKIGASVPLGAGQIIALNCSQVMIANQVLENCTIGIYLNHCSFVTVFKVAIRNSLWGFYLVECNFTLIADSIFAGIKWVSSIEGNSFIIYWQLIACRNTTVMWNAFLDRHGPLDDSGWGSVIDFNYWAEYAGVDANGDGIGDTPYLAPYGLTKDSHPLMLPPNAPLAWKEAAVDQILDFGVPFRYALHATVPYGVYLDTWWLDDTADRKSVV